MASLTDPASVVSEAGAPRHRTRLLATLAMGAALVVVTVAAAAATRMNVSALISSYTLTNTVIGIGFFASGWFIAWFRPRNIVGIMLLICGIGHLLSAAGATSGLYAHQAGWPVLLSRLLGGTLTTGAWQVGVTGLFPIALLVFPDGRLPSARWRPVVIALAFCGTYQLVTGVLSNGSALGDGRHFTSLISMGLDVPRLVVEFFGTANLVLWLLVVVSLIVRYRGAGERHRRQLLWLILAVVVVLVINSQRALTAEGQILLLLSFLLVPVAIGIAIVRYELLDIRLVLSRTLLYGLVIAVVIAGYAGIVAALSLVVSTRTERTASIAAALVVAICFNPLRLLVQRLVDGAFYGSRADPVRTAQGIGAGLRDDDDLAGVLDRARAGLRLGSLRLQRAPDGLLVATAGTPREDENLVELPLSYRGKVVGTLIVGLRRGETELHAADRKTLDLVGTPLAVALHATALAEQVQQARIATVEAAAAERVRLQRELHDGLGPTLTSLGFTADAAYNLLRTDPVAAESMLLEVRTELRTALDNVRRVVYGLRSIELDDLGLTGALRQRVAATGTAGVDIELDLPEHLPDLSPAVELAAYRIVNEAVANAARHSSTRECTVRLTAGDTLDIDVTDPGTPASGWTPGVGLRSITERAEEVGGAAGAGPTTSGWTVWARLPLPSTTG